MKNCLMFVRISLSDEHRSSYYSKVNPEDPKYYPLVGWNQTWAKRARFFPKKTLTTICRPPVVGSGAIFKELLGPIEDTITAATTFQVQRAKCLGEETISVPTSRDLYCCSISEMPELELPYLSLHTHSSASTSKPAQALGCAFLRVHVETRTSSRNPHIPPRPRRNPEMEEKSKKVRLWHPTELPDIPAATAGLHLFVRNAMPLVGTAQHRAVPAAWIVRRHPNDPGSVAAPLPAPYPVGSHQTALVMAYVLGVRALRAPLRADVRTFKFRQCLSN